MTSLTAFATRKGSTVALRALALAEHDVVGHLHLVPVPVAPPQQVLPAHGRQRDGRAVAVAALDAQPEAPRRRLLDLDRVPLAGLDHVAPHRQPVGTQT